MIMQKNYLHSALLLCLVLVGAAGAQTATATLAGQVTDERRAPVPGATVEAVNTATNRTLTAATNEDGRYLFTEMQPGVYRLKAQKPGFQTSVKEEVALNVASRAVQPTGDQTPPFGVVLPARISAKIARETMSRVARSPRSS